MSDFGVTVVLTSKVSWKNTLFYSLEKFVLCEIAVLADNRILEFGGKQVLISTHVPLPLVIFYTGILNSMVKFFKCGGFA